MKNHLTTSEIRLIVELRDKQKQYFRTRSKWILDECKTLEKQVDKILSTLQLEPERKTGSLF